MSRGMQLLRALQLSADKSACRFLNDAVRVLWPAFDRVLCQCALLSFSQRSLWRSACSVPVGCS